MARARNIKPAFFANDELAELDPIDRLFFIGLWTIADFKGDIKWRAKKVKALVLPYDNCDTEQIAINLDKSGFVRFYSVGDIRYLHIPNFSKHQNPHKNEREKGSEIPNFRECHATGHVIKGSPINPDKNGTGQDENESNRADSLILNPDSLILIPVLGQSEIDRLFDIFWCSGISKKNKATARPKFAKILKTLKNETPEQFTTMLCEDVKARLTSNQLGFDSMHPTTYLNGKRWTDEISTYQPTNKKPSTFEPKNQNYREGKF